jgi:hypothetical protein
MAMRKSPSTSAIADGSRCPASDDGGRGIKWCQHKSRPLKTCDGRRGPRMSIDVMMVYILGVRIDLEGNH